MTKPTVIQLEDGTERQPSKTKTLKDTFKAQTEKRLAQEKTKPTLSKPKEEYVSDKKQANFPASPEPKKTKEPKPQAESQKITILNKENPHAPGSKRGLNWDILLKSKTTDDYKKAKGRMALLPIWEETGHISLS